MVFLNRALLISVSFKRAGEGREKTLSNEQNARGRPKAQAVCVHEHVCVCACVKCVCVCLSVHAHERKISNEALNVVIPRTDQRPALCPKTLVRSFCLESGVSIQCFQATLKLEELLVSMKLHCDFVFSSLTQPAIQITKAAIFDVEVLCVLLCIALKDQNPLGGLARRAEEWEGFSLIWNLSCVAFVLDRIHHPPFFCSFAAI